MRHLGWSSHPHPTAAVLITDTGRVDQRTELAAPLTDEHQAELRSPVEAVADKRSPASGRCLPPGQASSTGMRSALRHRLVDLVEHRTTGSSWGTNLAECSRFRRVLRSVLEALEGRS